MNKGTQVNLLNCPKYKFRRPNCHWRNTPIKPTSHQVNYEATSDTKHSSRTVHPKTFRHLQTHWSNKRRYVHSRSTTYIKFNDLTLYFQMKRLQNEIKKNMVWNELTMQTAASNQHTVTGHLALSFAKHSVICNMAWHWRHRNRRQNTVQKCLSLTTLSIGTII